MVFISIYRYEKDCGRRLDTILSRAFYFCLKAEKLMAERRKKTPATIAFLLFFVCRSKKRSEFIIGCSQTSVTLSASQRRPPRVLWGIFTVESSDDMIESERRKMFRNLLAVAQNRTCPLSNVVVGCELIYTFVVGGKTEGRSYIRQLNSSSSDFLVPNYFVEDKNQSLSTYSTEDTKYGDITHLDIKENMDFDKSPTWLGYASKVMQDMEIDYVAKLDTDTLPLLDLYFRFVDKELPTNAKSHRIMAGILADTVTFFNHIPQQHYRDRANYMRPKFGDVPPHYYFRGEFYLLSKQLALDAYETYVTNFPEFPNWTRRFEDQIVTALVFASPGPVTAVLLAKSETFWKHPVKLGVEVTSKVQWHDELKGVKQRLWNQTLFEKVVQK